MQERNFGSKNCVFGTTLEAKNMYSAQNLGSKFYYPKDVKCQAYKYLKNVCQNLVNRNKTKIPSTWMGDHLAHEEPELEAI